MRNGARVNGIYFTNLFFEIGLTTDLIGRFRIYQFKDESIELSLETSQTIDPLVLEKLQVEMENVLAPVTIKIVSFIPNEKTGKYKYIVSEA